MSIEKTASAVAELFEKFSGLGLNYYISVSIFAICIVAALGMLFCSVVFFKPKGSLLGLFVFYEICFFINALLCVGESVYLGKVFKSVLSAYFFCLAEFATCLVFVFALYVQRNKAIHGKKGDKNEKYEAISSKTDVSLDRPNLDKSDEKSPRSYFNGELCEDSEKTETTELEKCIEFLNEPSEKKTCVPDVNVNYISVLLSALLTKNLSEDERTRLKALNVAIGRLPETAEESKALNAELRFLLKRVADYGIEP